jgi:hypothetical protein
MEIILEPGQTIKINLLEKSSVTFFPIAFGQQCFVSDLEIKNNTYQVLTNSQLQAFNASYETMSFIVER